MMAREETHDGALAVPLCKVMLQSWEELHCHVVSSTPSCNSVRNAATMLLTQHVIIYRVLVENYASCNTVTEVLDIFKIASVMFFT
jgi:hypothetical protein